MGRMGGLWKGSLGEQGKPSDTGRLVVVSSLLPEPARLLLSYWMLWDAEVTYVLIDEQDGNILAFRERLKSILNR